MMSSTPAASVSSGGERRANGKRLPGSARGLGTRRNGRRDLFRPPSGAPDPNINTAADEPVAGAAGGGGLRALDAEDKLAIAAAPGRTDAATYEARLTHCENLRDWVAILDGPPRTDDIGALPVSPPRCAHGLRGVGVQTPTPRDMSAF